MKSAEVEAAILEYMREASVVETVSAQYTIFMRTHSVPPVLIQVNRLVQPAYWKELSEMTGTSLDEIASATGLVVENARVQFTSMPAGTYVVCIAPRKEAMIL